MAFFSMPSGGNFGRRSGPGQSFDPAFEPQTYAAWNQERATRNQSNQFRQQFGESRRRAGFAEDMLRQLLGMAGTAMSGSGSGAGGGGAIPDLALSPELLNQIASTQQQQAVAGFQGEMGARNAALSGRGLRGGGFNDSANLAFNQAQKTSRGQFDLAAQLSNKDLAARQAQLGIASRQVDVQKQGQMLDLISRLFGSLSYSV